ncbi:MAG: Type-5 uracil-DNA glycosylase [Anaerolineales bacterium]|nr:Type-5 uracil-DNA glycosylase [Anaerolineales bacterium]
MPPSSQLKSLNKEIVSCRLCPRLVAWREEVARVKRKAYIHEEYWGKPVPGFGDPKARVLVVGLAPGAHGSNRTGRQFTGDASGDFLFPALHKAGFANQARAESRGDGLVLKDMYITASARCVPPDNKPSIEELSNCQPFLERELRIIQPRVIVCLGRIAFERILKIYGLRLTDYKFSHGATFTLQPTTLNLQPATLLCSYHPSQQNTSTGKLTAKMFDMIWKRAKRLLK